MRTLIKNARAIVTVDDQDRVLYGENLLVDGPAIAYIGKDSPDADACIDAAGCFVYPGLVNTHHHLYQTFTRNLPAVQSLELFGWLVYLYEIWRNLDELDVYFSSVVGLAELVKFGCTTCVDHHYVFPRIGNENFLEQQFRAADLLGVRFHATRGSMSRGKSDGGLPPDDLVQSTDEILRDSERLINRYHDDTRFSMHQIALAPCSPFSVTTDLLRESAKLARTSGVRLHTHLCETRDEEDFCKSVVGMRPLAYMESCGWVGADVWYAHGIHFNDSDIRLLSETGTGVAHCPTSNMKLSSGICRVPDLLKANVPLGLAVDGSASNDCSNMLAEIRTAYLLHRLQYSHEAPTGYDILKMATRGSASLIGRTDIGYLAPGMAADLFLLDVSDLEYAGTGEDPACFLGTVGYTRPAKLVMINGKTVCQDGVLSGIDQEDLSRRAHEQADAFLKKGR